MCVFVFILFWVFFIARNIASVESLTGKERNWYVKTDCNELLRFDPLKSSRNFVVHKWFSRARKLVTCMASPATSSYHIEDRTGIHQLWGKERHQGGTQPSGSGPQAAGVDGDRGRFEIRTSQLPWVNMNHGSCCNLVFRLHSMCLHHFFSYNWMHMMHLVQLKCCYFDHFDLIQGYRQNWIAMTWMPQWSLLRTGEKVGTAETPWSRANFKRRGIWLVWCIHVHPKGNFT